MLLNKKTILALILLCLLPGSLSAAMQSASYVIYDSVMHNFDGPVISGVGASVSGQTVTVSWATDILANSFVEFDTASDFSASRESGTSAKIYTSHSVVLSGLAANTQYFYRVKSERVNGGISVGQAGVNSFTTGSDAPSEGEEIIQSSGGGILIIDKRDKTAPVISNVDSSLPEADKARISWETDESATGFVEYGPSTGYGLTYGSWATGTAHAVELVNLLAGTQYNYRVISSDDYGNVAYSENFTFTAGQIEDVPGEEEGEDGEEEEIEPGVLEEMAESALDFLRRIFPQLNLNNIGPNGLDDIDSFEELRNFLPAPIMSGEPRIEVGATEVKVFWNTDVAANSLVALAAEEYYNSQAAEPYRQIIGNPEERSTSHEVTLYNLLPDTLYHFQLRSQGDIGPMARSADYTFRTKAEELSITSLVSQIVDDQTAILKWITNKAANTEVQYAPYRGNTLAIDLSKTEIDNAESVIHEIRLSNLEGGTFYRIEILSRDSLGNVARETLDRFSTSEDDNPPEISHIKADSTVFLDRSQKTQTIISWLTNEPATSRVYYQEGVHGSTAELKESTELNENYTKEHVIVITKFKPGVVYSFRVESIDSGGNIVMSKPHTFMTAKQRESIIQIIINILENTFGWMKKIV